MKSGQVSNRIGLFLAALSVCSLCACQRLLAPARHLEQPGASLSEAQETILLRIGVCWSAHPLVDALADTYTAERPDLAIEVIPGNSQTTRETYQAGQADLAIVGELPATFGSAPHWLDNTLALDAVALIVHRDSPLEQLSSQDLALLFAGRRLSWEELHAGSEPLALVTREREAVTRQLFERIIMRELAISSTALVMPHDNAIAQYVAENKGAIGYVSLAYLDERVKAIAIDGVAPDRNDIRRGAYPLVYPLIYLSRPGANAAQDFVSFAQSSRGRRLIEQYHVTR